MSRLKNKRKSERGASTGRKAKRTDSTGDQLKTRLDQFSEIWHEKAERERLAWLSKPRLHTAIFADAWQDGEIEKLLVANNGVLQGSDLFAQEKEKRRQEIERMTADLGWPPERLKLFMERVVAYRRYPSIQNYLRVRREFPEVEIQVAQFGGIEALFKLEKDFEKQGIDPDLVAGALDADEPCVDALCLRLLELLTARDAISKNGPGHIEKRRSAISDATVNYLISTIMEAFDWNDGTARVPASLVVLIRHQLCGQVPDLDMEVRLRERQEHVALIAGQSLKPGERLSINKLKELAGISRTTAARWLADPRFQSWLDTGRRWAAEGLFEEGKRAAIRRVMG